MSGPTLTDTQCEAALASFLTSHDWQLLTPHELWILILERSLPGGEITQEALINIAINCYCIAWHTACGASDTRRLRAYTELAHYLYDRALHKYGDREVAQEITHEAILLIAQQLDQVQNPGAFLAFALLKLWNAATTYFRQRDRQARHTQPLPDATVEDQPRELVDLHASLPMAVTESNELEQQVRTRIDALIAAAPRARSQLQAVLLKFLYGYSDAEIATALETDVANVHVLRSRGLNRLRADQELRQLFEEI
ncbi:MAG: RNA polymerase sigma factor [Caldilineaceae bacterium]|nr:RNA polymerase sigma factor [Caldilineaceae bacterium]